MISLKSPREIDIMSRGGAILAATLDRLATEVRPGTAPRADVTLQSSFDDFADVTAGRADPRVLVLRRRMRLRGRPRVLLKLPRLLG